jgi:hypothetical protein
MNVVQVTIYNRAGKQLADADCDIQSACWKLNQTGSAILSIDARNDKATRAIIRPGNRMLIQFNNGLPNWGGVIDLPLGVRGKTITFNGYEGDKILSWRVTSNPESHAGTPGAVVRELLAYAEGRYPIGIMPGSIYQNGDALSKQFRWAYLRENIQGLGDYSVSAEEDGGLLNLYLNFYDRRGVDRSETVLLAEGLNGNVGSSVIDEQGPVWNSIYAQGAGVSSILQDAGSVLDYGLREYPISYNQITDQTTLTFQAQNDLNYYRYPRRRATLSDVQNRVPGLFASYDVGDVVMVEAGVEAGEFGFNAPARVIAREWRAVSGLCTVEVEEWMGV